MDWNALLSRAMIPLFRFLTMGSHGPFPGFLDEISYFIVTSEVLRATVIIMNRCFRVPHQLSARMTRGVAKGDHVERLQFSRDPKEILYHAAGERGRNGRDPLRGQPQGGGRQMHV